MIPPEQNADFVAAMEEVLSVYKRPRDERFPVVCMDETPGQLIGETRKPIPAGRARPQRCDYEYRRCGTYNVFMACEPLAGRRLTKVTERKTRTDWALFLEQIADDYRDAEKITLVMDNLNTHKSGSLYETFAPEKARALRERFEFVFTPKHGSWINMAEIELNVLISQCLKRRIDNIDEVRREVQAWQRHRDNLQAGVNWRFTTNDARIKLRRLYPSLQM